MHEETTFTTTQRRLSSKMRTYSYAPLIHHLLFLLGFPLDLHPNLSSKQPDYFLMTQSIPMLNLFSQVIMGTVNLLQKRSTRLVGYS
jgi:hypothetical protein